MVIQNIEIGEIKNEDNRLSLLINAKKGIHAVESFIVSRYHMYEQVYFHKTTRGFELLVHKIFERLKDLIKTKKINESFFMDKCVFDFLNYSITKEKGSLDLTTYLSLDDFNLYTHFNHWIDNEKDEILKDLCKSLIYRKPYKMVKEVENDRPFSKDQDSKIREIIDNKEKTDYYWLEDNYQNIAYRDDYLLGKKTSSNAEHIWLKFSDGNLKELSEVSPVIKSLRNNELKKYRAYFHRDYHEKIGKILKK